MTHPATHTTHNALPYTLPDCQNARVLLFAIRRMGAHGLTDARAAHVMFTAFGEAFRRPLTLLRGLMADMAAHAVQPIAIAPCCCPRMTPSERSLLEIIARVETRGDSAHFLMRDLLGQRHVEGVLATADAVTAAFADEGRPVTA